MEPLPAPADLSLTGFLAAAREHGASNLHLAAGSIPRARIEGDNRPFDLEPLSIEKAEELAAVVRRLGEVGEGSDLDFCIDTGAFGRFRVNLHRQRRGAALSLKCIPREILDLETLGLPETLYGLTRFRVGLVLVTGSTNTGKTTTLASLLQRINETRREHVITLEDPIEYVFESELANVTQREIGRHSESFLSALRASLREDPDVILVSELRDLQTIRTAIRAAETGHLVLGTLHTVDAASTLSRLLDVFPPKEQHQIRTMLAGSLRAVVSQRLLPRLGGGRRVPAYEILMVTPAVSTLIRDGRIAQLASVLQTQRRRGMLDLDTCLGQMVKEGLIDRETARADAKNPDGFAPPEPTRERLQGWL